MLRLIRRLLLRIFLIGLFLLVCLRSLRYDHTFFADLRAALLFAPHCAPCYLDIRPGRTSMDEAERLLAARSDIHVQTRLMGQDSAVDMSQASVISIQFQHKQSPFFDTGWVETAYSVRVVNWIRLTTRLTLGDVWLAMGQPPEVAVYETFQVARYEHFSAQMPTACQHFWETPVEIIITDRRAPPPRLAPRRMRFAACQWLRHP